MNRLLLSATALTFVVLGAGRSHAQLIGATVCGKTVGIGVGASPVGYGYGVPTYGAPVAGHCGHGGFGYAMPSYGVPSYGVGYGAPMYGASCYGGGYGYSAPTYGASCYGGGYGAGASCYGGGYGMNYGTPDRCGNLGVGPADLNKKLDDLNRKLDDLQRFGLPKLQSSKSDSEPKPGASSSEVDTMLAEIDRAQSQSSSVRVGTSDPATVAADEWQAMLAEVDRTQVTRNSAPAAATRSRGPARR